MEQARKILGKDYEECWPALELILSKDGEVFFIAWLKDSIENRKIHAEKQRKRIQDYWDSKKKETTDIPRNNRGYSLANENANAIGNEIEKENIKEDKKEKPVKHKHGVYKHVSLTEEEFSRLKADFGQQKTDEMITNLDEYIQMKGEKYKDHNLTMRKWERKNNGGQQSLFQPPPKKEYPESYKSHVVRAFGNDYDFPDDKDISGWKRLYDERCRR